MANRRQFLHTGAGSTVMGLALSAGLLPATARADWNKGAFDAKGLNEVVKSLGGMAATESKDVQLVAPEIAENGNVVRVGAVSSVPGTTQVAILVEKNPNTLAALFELPEGTDANVATNIKMGQSSNIYALVKAGDKYYYAVKEVKVTLGGCGG